MGRSLSVPHGTMIPWDLAQAINEIRQTYGDIVDIASKSKTLRKFGDNDAIGASRETIWSFGGDETYVTSNLIDTVSSSAAGDSQAIKVEGHTVTGTGTDAQFTFVVQSATLNGQNKVTLSTPLARVSRLYNDDSTDFAGDVYVYQGTDTITSGVPDTASLTHMKVEGASGYNQSEKCATTFSNTDYFILTSVSGSVGQKTSASVDFYLEVRHVGKVFREAFKFTANQTGGNVQVIFPTPIIIPKNADIRIRGEASTTNVAASAQFMGFLAQVIGTE